MVKHIAILKLTTVREHNSFNDKFKDLSDKDAEKLQAGGDVTVYLDRDGNAVYISGAKGNVNSNTVGFHATEKAVYYYNNGLKDRGTVE